MNERTFQVKMPNGQIQEMSETMTKNLGRQVEVIGEVIGSAFKKVGSDNTETMTLKEFKEKHEHWGEDDKGRKVRKIDSGFERVAEVDPNSKPGGAQVGSDGVMKDRTVIVNGKEIPRAEWERMQRG